MAKEDVYDKYWNLLREGNIGLHKNIEAAISGLGNPTSIKDIDKYYPIKQYFWESPSRSLKHDGIYIDSVFGCIVNIDIWNNDRKTHGWASDSVEWLQKNGLLKIYNAEEYRAWKERPLNEHRD